MDNNLRYERSVDSLINLVKTTHGKSSEDIVWAADMIAYRSKVEVTSNELLESAYERAVDDEEYNLAGCLIGALGHLELWEDENAE